MEEKENEAIERACAEMQSVDAAEMEKFFREEKPSALGTMLCTNQETGERAMFLALRNLDGVILGYTNLNKYGVKNLIGVLVEALVMMGEGKEDA